MTYKVVSPCSEDWGKMKAVPGGRFCDRCQKKVHDLTGDLQLPQTGNRFCGRIRSIPPKSATIFNVSFWASPVLWLHILFLTLIGSKLFAQQTPAINDPQTHKKPDESKKKKITLKGTIVDRASKQSIPFGSIAIYDTVNNVHIQLAAATADLDGNFSLEVAVPGTMSKVNAEVVFPGYHPLELRNMLLYKDTMFLNLALDPLPQDSVQTYTFTTGMVVRSECRKAVYIDGMRYAPAVSDSTSKQELHTPGSKTLDRNRYNRLPNKELGEIREVISNGRQN